MLCNQDGTRAEPGAAADASCLEFRGKDRFARGVYHAAPRTPKLRAAAGESAVCLSNPTIFVDVDDSA